MPEPYLNYPEETAAEAAAAEWQAAQEHAARLGDEAYNACDRLAMLFDVPASTWRPEDATPLKHLLGQIAALEEDARVSLEIK